MTCAGKDVHPNLAWLRRRNSVLDDLAGCEQMTVFECHRVAPQVVRPQKMNIEVIKDWAEPKLSRQGKRFFAFSAHHLEHCGLQVD